MQGFVLLTLAALIGAAFTAPETFGAAFLFVFLGAVVLAALSSIKTGG